MAQTLASEGSNKAVTQEQYEHFKSRYIAITEEIADAVGRRKDLRATIRGAGGKGYLRAFDRALKDADKSGADRVEEDLHYRQMMEWEKKPIGYQAGFNLDDAPPPARLQLSVAELHEVDNEGYAAGKAGKAAAKNPWNPGTEPFDRWQNAWTRGQGDKVTAEIGKAPANGGTAPRRGRPPGQARAAASTRNPDRPRRVLSEEHKAAMQAGRLAKKAEKEAAEREKLN